MAPREQVKSKFAATFDCWDVDVTQIGEGEYDASGCGRSGRYECNQARCEPQGGMERLLARNEKPREPTSTQLWVNIKLQSALLTLMAEPDTGDTVTLSLLSAERGCAVAVVVDGERVHAEGGSRGALTLTRQTARALGQAERVVLKACEERWLLDEHALAKIRAFVVRFEEDLALVQEADDGTSPRRLPPRGGWQPWRSLSSQPAPSSAPLTATAVFEKVAPSVLRVEAALQLGGAQGSAVAISPKELLTNCHVLEGALKITVTHGGQTYPARLISSDFEGDRCVLEVAGAVLTPVAGVRPVADLRVGETLYTLGTPSGLDLSLASGILSAVRDGAGARYVQTTAPISPGSSGGGLFDANGNLVGITTMALVGRERLNQSLNFAIPAEAFWRP